MTQLPHFVSATSRFVLCVPFRPSTLTGRLFGLESNDSFNLSKRRESAKILEKIIQCQRVPPQFIPVKNIQTLITNEPSYTIEKIDELIDFLLQGTLQSSSPFRLFDSLPVSLTF